MMNARTFLLLIMFAFLGVFALLNWGAFSSPTELSLGLGTVTAPLGVVMLMVTALVSGLFMLYIFVQLAGALAESRRYGKELQSQRELADKAEASRFTELRSFITQEMQRADAQRMGEAARAAERLTALEQRLIDKLDESTRALSAYVGEVDDKLNRALLPVSK